MQNNKSKNSTSSSKNYFKDGEGKKNSRYKLWVLWKDEYASVYPANPFVYYGYNRRKDNGQHALLRIAVNKKPEFKVAILYNNLTGEKILTIPGLIVQQANIKTDETEHSL